MQQTNAYLEQIETVIYVKTSGLPCADLVPLALVALLHRPTQWRGYQYNNIWRKIG